MMTHFSKLVESARHGEETIIARSGKPIARIAPISKEKPTRRLGILKGKIKIADDFDETLPDDVLDSFDGH